MVYIMVRLIEEWNREVNTITFSQKTINLCMSNAGMHRRFSGYAMSISSLANAILVLLLLTNLVCTFVDVGIPCYTVWPMGDVVKRVG